ncbi:MAG: hypothetical protein IPP72_04375 [Chitinophagaceae bacterium]|nr:hypothetical protein [Chitinophagaceae bacterium]
MTKIKNIAVALSAIVLFAGNSFATTVNNAATTAVYEEPVADLLSVNYIGEDANFLYFQVSVKKGANKNVSFAVNDQAEGELYSVVLNADKVQTLKIEKRDGQHLDFNVKAGKKNFSKSFTIMPTVMLDKI